MGISARMFVRTKAAVTAKEVRRASVAMCMVFGPSRFWIDHEQKRHALEVVTKYEQDGPTIRPRPGETFICVHLSTRYWGPGYERGDLGLICGVAEFLERRFPKGVVWYGGDSSGVLAERFDAKARAALFDHAAGEHGADYRAGFAQDPKTEHCDFCDCAMSTSRWGSNLVGFVCMGCDRYRLVVGGGSTAEAIGRWPDERKGVN